MNKKKPAKKGYGKVIKSIEEKDAVVSVDTGLKLQWVRFIDEYIKNGGNGQAAYMIVYPDSSEKAARSSASTLLANPNIRKEIDYRYTNQRVTEDAIIGELWDLVDLHKSGKGAIVAMKALECLAKTKGMLVDTKRFAFSGDNPAVFLPVCSPERAKELEAEASKGRILE